MIDESFDTEQMKQPEQPWEFRTKPTWQRLLIMIGGVLVNFLLALFIYSMVLFYWGDSYIAVSDMSMGMKYNQQAKALGFQDHDVLYSYDGKTFGRFDVDVFRRITEAKTVQVLRNGKKVSIDMPEDMSLLTMLQSDPPFARPFVPADIDSVMPNTIASKIGMLKGDVITSLNDKPIDSWNEFTYQMNVLRDMLSAAETNKDSLAARTVTIAFKHKDEVTDTARVTLAEDMLLGVGQTSIYTYYEPTTVAYGFFESFPAGLKDGLGVLRGYVDDLKYVFTADGAKSLGGFGAIGSLFPPVWDWMMFWRMTAFLSIILAFMNILPIPALDGGHVLFLIYEMITGRKPSENFMIKAEYVGFTILILLMIVANLNDILRWLGYM